MVAFRCERSGLWICRIYLMSKPKVGRLPGAASQSSEPPSPAAKLRGQVKGILTI
jgi:hypothetical protein